MRVWERLRYFGPEENWGDPEKMNGLLLLLLDALREGFGEPFIVHCGYETSGHSPQSQHYLGNAVDFHIQSEMPFSEQVHRMLSLLEDLQVSRRVGLGIYPDWAHPGFHLDVRGQRARWGRIEGQYCSFEKALRYAKTKEKEV